MDGLGAGVPGGLQDPFGVAVGLGRGRWAQEYRDVRFLDEGEFGIHVGVHGDGLRLTSG